MRHLLTITLTLLLLLAGASGPARAGSADLDAGLEEARALLESGQPGQALDRLDALARTYPRSREIPLLRARIHHRQGDTRQERRSLFEACSLGAGEACIQLKQRAPGPGERPAPAPQP